MRKYLLLPVVAALAAGGQAAAGDLSYSYLQVDAAAGMLTRDGSDEYDDSKFGTGFGAHGSVGIGSHLYGFLDLTSTRYKDEGVSTRIMPRSLGVGVHWAVSPRVEYFAGASSERLKLKYSGLILYSSTYGYSNSLTQSLNGWGIAMGLRGVIRQHAQWSTSIKYRDINNLDSIVSVTVGARFYSKPNFSLGVELTNQMYGDDSLDSRESIVGLNFRYAFGTR